MKREEKDKQEMQELRKKMEEKKQEIEDEIVPGSYFYDVDKVEELKNEIDELNKKFIEIDAVPTREIIEDEKGVWDQKLEEIDEELSGYYKMYQKTEELIELEEQRKEVKQKIEEKQEILNVIDSIEKVEQELEDLYEEKDEYIKGFYISPELLTEIETKEAELLELNKRLEEFTEKRILDANGIYHMEPQAEQPQQPQAEQPQQRQAEQPQQPQAEQPQADQPQPGQPQADQPQPGQPQADQPQPEQPQADQPQPEQPQADQPQPEQPPQADQPKQQPQQPLVKITIGRKGKIEIGKRTYEVSKEIVREGIQLDSEDTIALMEKHLTRGLSDKMKSELSVMIDSGAMDPTVIKVISYATMDGKTKTDAIKDYINKCMRASNKEKFEKTPYEIAYDQKSLSKTNIFSRIFRKEMNSNDKYRMITKAQTAARYGVADLVGQYNPSFVSKIMNRITRSEATKLLSDKSQKKIATMFNETLNNDYSKLSKKEEFVKGVHYNTMSRVEKQELKDLKDWQKAKETNNKSTKQPEER